MGHVTRDVGSDNAGRNEGLQVVRGEAGMLCDAGQHAGADFFSVVKREDEVRPVGVGENLVRAGGVPR